MTPSRNTSIRYRRWRRVVRSSRVWLAIAALPALALFAASGCEPTNQGYAPEQPISYSHAVHAGALQIPCQYCHFAAERGRHAGIPPASVCLNCHEKQVQPNHPEIVRLKEFVATGTPIPWKRVHRLPDHAYFDHSAHVAADVACETCHGPIASMGRVTQWAPLTMGWCIDCHRQRGAAPAEQGMSTALAAASSGEPPPGPAPSQHNRLTDCAVCHH